MNKTLQKAISIAKPHGIEIDIEKERPFHGYWMGFIDAPKGMMFGSGNYMELFRAPIRLLPGHIERLVNELTEEDDDCRAEREHAQG